MKTPGDEKESARGRKKYHILVVPGKLLRLPGYVRIAYCVSYEQIERALPEFKKLAAEYGLPGGE